MTGQPIAVTLVSKATADLLLTASTSNGRMTLAGGIDVSPADMFRTLGWSNDAATWMTVVIVNYLDKPLVEVDHWMNQGAQAAYPVESDLVGEYWTGLAAFPHCPGTPGGSIAENQIPAARPHPCKPGVTLYGVGAYQFQQTSAVYGAEGVITFKYGGASVIGLAFADPCRSMFYPSLAAGCRVTANMSGYAYDQKTFFMAAPTDCGATQQSDSNSEMSISASVGPIDVGDPDSDFFCVTAVVRPK